MCMRVAGARGGGVLDLESVSMFVVSPHIMGSTLMCLFRVFMDVTNFPFQTLGIPKPCKRKKIEVSSHIGIGAPRRAGEGAGVL